MFTFAFLLNVKNGFCGSKWWYSHLTLERDGKDQRKTQNAGTMRERTVIY